MISFHVVDMGEVALCQRSLDFLFLEDINLQLMEPLNMQIVLQDKNAGLWQLQNHNNGNSQCVSAATVCHLSNCHIT